MFSVHCFAASAMGLKKENNLGKKDERDPPKVMQKGAKVQMTLERSFGEMNRLVNCIVCSKAVTKSRLSRHIQSECEGPNADEVEIICETVGTGVKPTIKVKRSPSPTATSTDDHMPKCSTSMSNTAPELSFPLEQEATGQIESAVSPSFHNESPIPAESFLAEELPLESAVKQELIEDFLSVSDVKYEVTNTTEIFGGKNAEENEMTTSSSVISEETSATYHFSAFQHICFTVTNDTWWQGVIPPEKLMWLNKLSGLQG